MNKEIDSLFNFCLEANRLGGLTTAYPIKGFLIYHKFGAPAFKCRFYFVTMIAFDYQTKSNSIPRWSLIKKKKNAVSFSLSDYTGIYDSEQINCGI